MGNLCKEKKIAFLLEWEKISLDKGLLMGDPFPFMSIYIKSEGNNVPHDYLTGVHPVTAGRCAEKGRKLFDSYEGMWEVLN